MLLLQDNSTHPNDIYLELLVKYIQIDKFNNVKLYKIRAGHAKLLKIDILPQFLTSENTQLVSTQQISAHLLSLLNWEEVLIGKTVDEKSDVFKYFDFVSNQNQNTDKILSVLQNELKENTFLNGNSNLKISDLYVFSRLFHFMVNASFQVKSDNFHVYRWFNYLQNMKGIKESLLDMKFRLMEEINVCDIPEVHHATQTPHLKKEPQTAENKIKSNK